jgi:hypothetical protein
LFRSAGRWERSAAASETAYDTQQRMAFDWSTAACELADEQSRFGDDRRDLDGMLEIVTSEKPTSSGEGQAIQVGGG